jgi:hypothetical protein
MAARAKLPPSLVEMIPQHHGTRRIRFFEEKAHQQDPEAVREIPAETFRYGGPKPQTKAACILMLADQIEAAARTLDSHAPEKLAALIGNIIAEAAEDKQFSESDLTLADLEKITASFQETLVCFYHGRIAYPESDSNGPSPNGPGGKQTGGDDGEAASEPPKKERRRKRFFRAHPAALKEQGCLFS